MGGHKVDGVDLATILRKRITIRGSTLRARSLEYKAKLTDEFSRNILPLIESGVVRIPIDKIFDWKQVAEAHRC
jgi:NADPH:quinone reductase-like Zn-dependent oxidoreductase